ncbi:NUDIX domain-containing protein [Paenibacillus ginsengarvi]|nr:NUDIX domain-containing protein [Paenibacillus ginsengarvi]
MEVHFRHIARAVIVHENKILIARLKGAHAFLPGGGVEPGEGAQQALQRELYEELGVVCAVHRFMGVLETHRIDEKGVLQHEISHLFEVSSEQLTSFAHPRSQEDHLDFHWIDLNTDQIKRHDVLPRMMQEHLVRLVAERDCVWMSTFTPT